MTIVSFRPNNTWLRPKLDGSWRRWLVAALLYGGALAAVLVATAAPRQERVRLAYEIARLREEVAELERKAQELELTKNTLLAPHLLARSLEDLGLATPAPSQVWYLTPQGTLRATPVPQSPGRPTP